MKKFWLLLLCLIVLAVPISAQAMPSPLSRVSSAAKVFEDNALQVISYKAYINVDSNITKTNAILVIKNTGEEAQNKITLGLPSDFNEGTIKINEAEIYMDGAKQQLISRRDRTEQEETAFDNMPKNWLTWKASLEPQEYKVIEFSYQTETQYEENGSSMVYIPFEFLKAWSGTPQNIEFTIDFGDAEPYMFEPNPSVLPHDYDGKGRLSWKYNNSYPPDSIQVYYRSIEHLAGEYLIKQTANDRAVENIVTAFTNKSYDKTITLINQYLETGSESSFKKELLYLQALAYQGLCQNSEAMALFDQLETQPLFGGLEETFKNRIIFDKYNYMKSMLTDDSSIYTYMDSAKNYVMDNSIFLMWIEEELNTLEPAPTPEITPSPTMLEPLDKDKSEAADDQKDLITSVNIGGYEIPVEIIFIGIVVIIILLIIIFRKRKRRKSNYYLFR